MPLFLQGSGVRIWRRKSGPLYHHQGELHVAHAPKVGLDSHLVSDLKAACDDLGLRLWINSTDGGQHTRGSRHYRGLAVDIARIAFATKEWQPVTTDTHEARLLVRYLGAQGFRHYEGGNWPAVLLGRVDSEFNQTDSDHSDHLHLSLWR